LGGKLPPQRRFSSTYVYEHLWLLFFLCPYVLVFLYTQYRGVWTPSLFHSRLTDSLFVLFRLSLRVCKYPLFYNCYDQVFPEYLLSACSNVPSSRLTFKKPFSQPVLPILLVKLRIFQIVLRSDLYCPLSPLS